ncbi:MAG: hypothetical protein N3B12_00145 [Armatimonadetes bacterium]|nr:hypothetical protein [Armatimonadota bacterium]
MWVDNVPSVLPRFFLPYHASKRYYTYARLNRFVENSNVILRCGSKVIAQAEVYADPIPEDDVLIVTVGSRSTTLSFLNGLTIRSRLRSGSPQQSTISTGFIQSDRLPDRTAAYDGVDVLVLADLDPASVNPKALGAISMWVASGGVLIIPTGPDYRRFQNDFYDDLLPVKLVGTTDLPSMQSLSDLGNCAFPRGR